MPVVRITIFSISEIGKLNLGLAKNASRPVASGIRG
jgi:hypothetical protein